MKSQREGTTHHDRHTYYGCLVFHRVEGGGGSGKVQVRVVSPVAAAPRGLDSDHRGDSTPRELQHSPHEQWDPRCRKSEAAHRDAPENQSAGSPSSESLS